MSRYFDGLIQDFSNSIANALGLLQSCTKPSIWCHYLISQLCDPFYIWCFLECEPLIQYACIRAGVLYIRVQLASKRTHETHDNAMTWKHFPQYWRFMWGDSTSHRSLAIFQMSLQLMNIPYERLQTKFHTAIIAWLLFTIPTSSRKKYPNLTSSYLMIINSCTVLLVLYM